MPAHDVEVEEAVEEGVCMKWLSTVKAVEGGKLVLERTVLDEKGFPRPTGELEELRRRLADPGAGPGVRGVPGARCRRHCG